MDTIQRIAVVGAGFMGSGIAQVCAQAGYTVALIDTSSAQLSRARRSIEWSVVKLESKALLDETAAKVLERIATSGELDAARDADLVVEAVFEDVDAKLGVFRVLDDLCGPDAILGSNTSTIPITRLASATRRPERVIGVHFFGPVPLMRLVEIIPHAGTKETVVEATVAFGRAVGKNPIVVKKDIPGFLMNRIFGVMACEAIRLLEDGAGSIEDIDQGMCDGFNLRVGPLCIADLAGLDIALNAFRVMHELDPARIPAPPALLEKLVRAGKFGAKSGEGFYRWAENGKRMGPAF
ncbi:MAG: 3-hydroxybutyryl-CoA dehydrogenase [Candidatus Hydrogenedentota bacterium]